MQRVYETLAVCALLIVVILCLLDVVLALLSSSVSLLSITSVNLPLIYSCVSFCGVGLLLVSTPIGFARMFSIVGEMAIIPLRQKSLRWYHHVMLIIKYPIIIISLLMLTGLSLLMVIINSLSLMFGYRGLPAYAQYMEVQTRHTLGMPGAIAESITIFYFERYCGILVFYRYVMATSLVGLYSMPFVRTLRPIPGKTSMTAIIINCSLVLVLSSALPVLANTLGITTFDLLGAYSSLEWLSNFRLVLAYNVLFAVATMFCLVSQITNPVRKQIIKRLALKFSITVNFFPLFMLTLLLYYCYNAYKRYKFFRLYELRCRHTRPDELCEKWE
uniref:G_PROTEIN_RECEP_F1_2 domain-containing protein n=1 Tax=Heterorhabditis bacteriophora TaxID=37862 RepID=A0A1I7XGH4_HETBA